MDLFSLLHTIWDGKWVIVLFCAVSLVAGGTYVAIYKTGFEGTLRIGELSNEIIPKLSFINGIERLGKPIIVADVVVGYEDIVTSKSVYKTFIEEFNDYEEIRDAIRQHSSAYAKFEGAEDERQSLLINLAKNYKLVIQNSNAGSVRLEFTTSNRDEVLKIVTHFLSNISRNTNLLLVVYLKNLLEGIRQQSLDKVSVLERKIDIREKSSRLKWRKKVVFE